MNITVVGITFPKISMATTTRDYFDGGKILGVALYHDDHEKKERRIIAARFYVTPTGRVKKNQTLEIELTRCAGYDADKHKWGGEHYGSAWRAVTPEEAKQLLELGERIECSDDYHHHGNRNYCTHYWKGN